MAVSAEGEVEFQFEELLKNIESAKIVTAEIGAKIGSQLYRIKF